MPLRFPVLFLFTVLVYVVNTSCPSGSSQSGPYDLWFYGGWCTVCGRRRGYNCGSYRTLRFNDPAGRSRKVVKAYAYAYGALRCGGGATGYAYLNGWLFGSHPQTGTCWCGRCHRSRKMDSGNHNNGVPRYNYGSTNTLSYSKSGRYMCTAYLRLYLCHKASGCNKGQYKSGGSCVNCPRGRYRDKCCGTHINHCSHCPAGKYGSSTGLTSSNCNGNCHPGHYCPTGSTSHNQNRCPAGRYGSSYGLSNSNCNGACSPGYYCPAGSTTSRPSSYRCKAGRYGNSGETSDNCAGSCQAGYYCPRGSSSPKQNACGGNQYYCPSGTGSRRTASPGYYTVGGGSTTRTEQRICPSGHYCSDGVKRVCPTGRYGSSNGLSSSSCSGPCRAGFFCPAGSTSDTEELCGDHKDCVGLTLQGTNCYCPAGSSSRRIVSKDHYSVPTDESALQRTGQKPCPDGFDCQKGEKLANVVFQDCPVKMGGTYGKTERFIDEDATNRGVEDENGNVSPISATSKQGDSLTYRIVNVDKEKGCNVGNPFSINSRTGELRVGNTGVSFEQCPSYKVMVEASDKRNPVQCRVTVQIKDRNERPTISGCTARDVEEGTPKHTGVGDPIRASDPDLGQELTFSIVSNPGPFKISGCSGQIGVAREFRYSEGSSYALRIRVTDNGGGNLHDECTLNIRVLNRNDPPEMTDKSFTIDENRKVDALVGLMMATDPDGDQLSYSVSRPDTPDAFKVDSDGRVRVKQEVLDYETKRAYVFDVRASDGDKHTDAKVKVQIKDANDPPVVPDGLKFKVAELSAPNTPVGSPVKAVDEDGDSLTYELTDPDGFFTIDSSSGQIRVAKSGLDFESTPERNVVVMAKDSSGSIGSAAVEIALSDVNEAPSFPDGSRTVQENSPRNTIVSGGPVTATDIDAGQQLFYSIKKGFGDEMFVVEATTGELKVIGDLDYESKQEHKIRVIASDSGSPPKSAEAEYTISVSNANDAPSLATTSLHADENSNDGVTVGTLQASDQDTADAGQHTFEIVEGNRGSAFALDPSSGELTVNSGTMLDHERSEYMDLKIKVTDPAGAFNMDILRVHINDKNERCEFVRTDLSDIGPLKRMAKEKVPAGTKIGNPVVAKDPDDGQKLTYSITGGATQYFEIDPDTAQIRAKTRLPAATTLSLKLRCTDNGGTPLSSDDDLSITLSDVNEPPVLDDTSRSVAENSPVNTKVGAPVKGSDNDAGQTETLQYEIILGNDGAAFAIDKNSGQLTVANPINFEQQSVYELDVKVTDQPSKGPSMWDTAKVTINIQDVNESPSTEDEDFTVKENQGVDTAVGTPIKGVDVDSGDQLRFEIISGNVDNAFKIDENTGQVRVRNPVLDFEKRPEFNLQVRVSDKGNLFAVSRVSISIADANDKPSFGTLSTARVPEDLAVGTEVGAPVQASDEDAGDEGKLRYSIVSGNVGSPFSLDADSGKITLVKPLDFETLPAYDLAVQVVDSQGATAQATLRVDVLNVNEPPKYTGATSAVIAENSARGTRLATASATDEDAGDTLTWAISDGNNGDAFEIDRRTGRVTVKTASELNFEPLASKAPVMYNLTLVATDKGGLTGVGFLIVEVTDVNEPPRLVDSSQPIREDVSGEGPWPVGVQLTVADEDFGQTHTISIIDDDGLSTRHGGPVFELDGRRLMMKQHILNYEAKQSYKLRVRVEDDGSPKLSRDADFKVDVVDANERPIMVDQSREVEENVKANTPVGEPLVATDPDIFMDQMLTFKIIGGSGASKFTIDACSGQIKVQTSDSLNYEERSEYELEVEVRDDGTDPPGPARLSTVATVNITILDVNEAPVVPDTSRVVRENAEMGTELTPVVHAEDEDFGDVLTYSITQGNDGESFTIDPETGLISVTGDINYEERKAQGFVYRLTVRATDDFIDPDTNLPDPLYGEGVVVVNVTDVNEEPVFDAASLRLQVEENSAAGAIVGRVTATDEDFGHTETLEFSLTGGEGVDMFSVESSGANAGLVKVAKEGLDFESKAAYFLDVTVTDVGGLVVQDTLRISLIDVNEQPEIEDQSRTIDENAAVGSELSALESFDVDGDHLTFRIVSGNDNDAWKINTDTGVLSVNKDVLDYETQSSDDTGAVNHRFDLVVRVSDGELSDSAVITVTLLDVNEPPMMREGISLWVEENSPAGSIVQAEDSGEFSVDPDAGDVVVHTLEVGYGSELFSLDPSKPINSAVTIAAGKHVDYELNDDQFFKQDRRYQLTVRATDKAGLSTTGEVEVRVVDVNELPYLPSGRGTLFVSQHGVDDDDEEEGLLLGMQDWDWDKEDDSSDMVLAYAIVSGNDRYYDSNDVAHTVTGNPLFAVDGETQFEGQSCLEDQEKTGQRQTCGIGRLGSGTGVLSINNKDSTAFQYPHYFRLTTLVFDPTGLNVTQNFTIQVTKSNRRPKLAYTVLTVEENSPVDTVMSPMLTAEDKDAGQSVTYSIENNESPFDVRTLPNEGNTDVSGSRRIGAGEIFVRDARLDYESKKSFNLTVRVVDNGGDLDPALGYKEVFSTVTVVVEDVNEAPYISKEGVRILDSLRVQETTSTSSGKTGTPGTALDSTLQSYGVDVDEDPADSTLTYSLEDVESPSNEIPFAIDESTGVISISTGASIDFESLAESMSTPSYRLRVTVADPKGLKDSYEFTVMVDDVNETPEVPAVVVEDVAEDVADRTQLATVKVNDVDDHTGEDAPFRFRVLDKTFASGQSVHEYFAIDDFTGVLRVAEGAPIDYEDQGSFEFTVEVLDGDLSVTTTVSVTLSDIDDMTIVSFSPTGPFKTNGGDVITIVGSNFGPTKNRKDDPEYQDLEIVATYGGPDSTLYQSSCSFHEPEESEEYKNTVITCTTAPGIGKNHFWKIDIGTGSAMSPNPISYAKPELSRVSGFVDVPTEGMTRFVLEGDNFGPAGVDPNSGKETLPRVEYGPDPNGRYYLADGCEVLGQGHHILECRSVEGVGSGLEFRVEIGGQTSKSLVTSASYASPVVHVVNTTRIPLLDGEPLLDTRGQEVLLLEGENFGPHVVAYGASDESLVEEHNIQVHYGPSSSPARYRALECSLEVPHRVVRCLTAVGAGKGLHVMMTVAQQNSNASVDEVAYRPPVVVDVFGAGVEGGSTKGQLPLNISGSQFSTAEHAVRVWYGPAGDVKKYEADKCAIKSQSLIECMTVEGVGKDLSFLVSVEEQESNQLETKRRYGSPVVTDYSTPPGSPPKDKGRTVGGDKVLVHGRNFGPMTEMDVIDLVYYGMDEQPDYSTTQSCRVVVPHEQLECSTVAGAGHDLTWSVTIAGQISVASTTAYHPPVIQEFRRVEDEAELGGKSLPLNNFHTDGGQRFSILGENFGPPSSPGPYLDAVTYGPDGVGYDITDKCTVVDHSRIDCETLPGSGSGHQCLVTIRGQRSRLSSKTISYAPPVVDSMTPDGSAPPTGETKQLVPPSGEIAGVPVVITLVGTNFGLHQPFNTHIRINGRGVDESKHQIWREQHYTVVSESSSVVESNVESIEARLETSEQRSDFALLRRTVLSSNRTRDIETGVWNENAVVVQKQINANGDTTVKVTTEKRVTVQSVRFELPPGEGANNEVQVEVGGLGRSVLSSVSFLHYEIPEISRVSSRPWKYDISDLNIPLGGRELEVSGLYFGQSPTLYITLDDSAKSVTEDVEVVVADGLHASGTSTQWDGYYLWCNGSTVGADVLSCYYYDPTREYRGALWIADRTHRVSNTDSFTTISPGFAALTEPEGAKIFTTKGTFLFWQDMQSLSSEVSVRVDGILCEQDPPSSRWPYLDKYPPRFVSSCASLPEEERAECGSIQCIVPVGYEQRIGGVEVVVYNQDQPSKAIRYKYVDPEGEEVSQDLDGDETVPTYEPNPQITLDTSGSSRAEAAPYPAGMRSVPLTTVDTTKNRLMSRTNGMEGVVTITGANFGDLSDIDRVCRNTSLVDVKNCRKSLQCEVYTADVGNGQVEERCRARCGRDDCDKEEVSAMALGKVFALTASGQHIPLVHKSWTHDKIEVGIPAGVGQSLELLVQLGLEDEFVDISGGQGLQYQLPDDRQSVLISGKKLSYLPPRVTSIEAAEVDANDGRPLIGTAGGDLITIRGSGFHPKDAFISAGFVGPHVHICKLEYDDALNAGKAEGCRPCDVVEASYDWIQCNTPAGSGRNRFVMVTTGANMASSAHMQSNLRLDYGTDSAARVHYASPIIESVLPDHGATHSGTVVTVRGRNFGSTEEQEVKVMLVGFHEVGGPSPNIPNEKNTRVPMGATTRSSDVPPDATHAFVVPPGKILSRNNTHIVFELPLGENYYTEVNVKVTGQHATVRKPFYYDAPEILGVYDEDRNPLNPDCCNGATLGGDKLLFVGRSFGTGNQTVLMSTFFDRDFAVDLKTGYPRGWRTCSGVKTVSRSVCQSRIPPVDAQSMPDDAVCIECVTPDGVGRDLELRVLAGSVYVLRPGQVQKSEFRPQVRESPNAQIPQEVVLPQSSNPVPFHYMPPEVRSMEPFPANANGGKLKFNGKNFGSRDPDMNEKLPRNVTINELECRSVEVADASTLAPRLECRNQMDTAGPKNLTLHLAGQTVVISDNITKNAMNDIFFTYRAVCDFGWYGQRGEYCTRCPLGAVCDGRKVVAYYYVGRETSVEYLDQASPLERRNNKLDDPERVWGTYVISREDVDWNNDGIPDLDKDESHEPFADEGFFDMQPKIRNSDGTYNDECVDPTWPSSEVKMRLAAMGTQRTRCPYFLPCQPEDACLHNNTCSRAYSGERCKDCTEGYYRLDGECEECPDQAWMLIVGFLLGAMLLMVGGYLLNRKNMHLAFVAIGVDYFQVLALFARSKVAWPSTLKRIYQILSVFNFNVELTAPECSIPNLNYEMKWFFTMSAPLVACGFLLVMHIGLILYKFCVKGRRKNLTRHVSALIGVAFVIHYYLYLFLVRTSLDIMNCAPLQPDKDGKEYMSSVMEPCGEPGGVQMTLLPWAIVGLCFYGIGFPLLSGFILYRHREKIMEDQVLRAYGLGDNHLQNPNAYQLRKRYHKMYYHFTPSFWYWKLLIFGRKFMVAFTSLMFRKNVTFQLSMLLLVLIIAYALQVRFRPYMSMSDKHKVAEEHERLAKMGHPVHSRIQADLKSIFQDVNRRPRESPWNRKKDAAAVASFFFDYNTVESVLLYCAVLVAISGIMFESGQFTEGDMETEREIVTWAVIFVIFFSIIYFFAVFLAEMYITLCPKHAARTQAKWRKKHGNAEMMKKDDVNAGVVANPMLISNNENRDSRSTSVGMNPMFMKAARANSGQTVSALMDKEDAPDQHAWSVIREGYSNMQQELADTKKRLQALEAQRAVGMDAVARRTKATFGQQLASNGSSNSRQAAPSQRFRRLSKIVRRESISNAGKSLSLNTPSSSAAPADLQV